MTPPAPRTSPTLTASSSRGEVYGGVYCCCSDSSSSGGLWPGADSFGASTSSSSSCGTSGSVCSGFSVISRLLRFEVLHSRSLDHAAGNIEARAVAGAVPRAFGLVPLHLAAEVRADGGDLVERAVLVAVGGDLRCTAPHDAAAPRRERADRVHVGPAEVVAHEAHTDVRVLLHKLLGGGERLEAGGVEEAGPRVLATGDQVGEDHPRGRAVREPPFHEPG